MKIFLTIIGLFAAGLTFSQTGENNNCILTIEKGKVEKQNKQTFWIIPTTLTNNLKDTLEYFSMLCSWQDFYSVSNNKLQIETAVCAKNIPAILILASGQSKTVEIKLLVSQTMDTSETKFKIGFNLMKASNTQKPLDFNYEEERRKKNVIWSNVISM